MPELLQDDEGVPEGAAAAAGDEVRRRRIQGDPLRLGHPPQHPRDRLLGDGPELKRLAPGKDGGGTLWGSVVAKINRTWGGGSSRVLRRALNASPVSMWTSSMMYTLYRLPAGT